MPELNMRGVVLLTLERPAASIWAGVDLNFFESGLAEVKAIWI